MYSLDDPLRPRLVQIQQVPAYGLAGTGTYLYALRYAQSRHEPTVLTVLDSRSAPALTSVNALPLFMGEGKVAALGSHQVVCTKDRVLWVVDALKPHGAEASEAVTLPGALKDLVVRDTTCYGVTDNRVFVIIDLSPPARPAVVRTLDLGDSCFQLAAEGDLVVTSGEKGLYLVDVRTSASAALAGSCPTKQRHAAFCLRGTRVYLLDSGSLVALDAGSPASPQVTATVGRMIHADQIQLHGA